MRLSQFIEREPVERRKKKGAKPSIAAHGAFVPLVTVWGAALLSLSLLVMPQAVIDRFIAVSGLGAFADMMRYALAGTGAVLGGAFGFLVSNSMHKGVDVFILTKARRNLNSLTHYCQRRSH